VFTREVLKKPSFHFETENLPGVKMEMTFNGQMVHSRFHVLAQADFDDNNEVNKVESKPLLNPYIPNQNNVYRPKVAMQSKKSENAIDVDQSANNIRASETRALSLTIDMDRWDLNGKIVRPGQVISTADPAIYNYRKIDWFIEGVTLIESANSLKKATLRCCPQEAFTGTVPNYPFSGINLHPID
jgi:prophage tail gpP-like protein